jgi:multicomponent K+:H+ antiporter subunit E
MRAAVLVLWSALTAMWVTLAGALTVAHVILGALVALVAVRARASLQPAAIRLRRPLAAVALAGIVAADIVRSNVAVARIVLRPGAQGRVPGFVEIPLDTRNPAALAALACIITATPGTAWAGYDARSNTLTMHVLDLADRAESARTIKERYERPLMEIFE